MRRRLFVLGFGVAGLGLAPAFAGAFERSPEEACAYLADEGLSAVDRYREYRDGQYYCWSLRKEIATGDSKRHYLRYEAQGSADQVSRLTLDLRVVSASEVQAAHKAFLGHVKALVKQALGEDPPPPLDAAVMAGRPGRWPLAGADLVLEKANTQGASYDLVFRIQ